MTCIPAYHYRQVRMCKSTLSKSRFDKFDSHCVQLTVKARCAIIGSACVRRRGCGHCLTLVPLLVVIMFKGEVWTLPHTGAIIGSDYV